MTYGSTGNDVEGCRYGKWVGLWLSTEEAEEDMLHVTSDGEQPVLADSVSEGDILQDKTNHACVFEVFLYDHVRDLIFLTEV